MLKRIIHTAFATIAIALTPGAALVALADDAAPTADPSFRPPTGVLRHVDAPTASAAPLSSAVPQKPELVIFVGGYQTCACELPAHKTGFGDYADRVTAAGFDVKYFGQDTDFPYDTYGHVAESGRSLRDEIRSLSSQYAAVHIVAHSMGGVVVDQAFAQGLSAVDGVATYIALSSPHNGSDAARAANIVDTFGDGDLLRRVASLGGLGFETRSDAVRDLASVRPIAPPTGIVRLDLRESTDELVTARDANDPGVPSRILTASSIDGHGDILSDPSAIDLTLRTIATRRVPPDERGQKIVEAARRQSDLVGILALLGIGLIAGYCLWRKVASGRMPEDFAFDLLPHARRRPCP